MSRVIAIASNTFTGLTRQKVFYILLIFAIALIASSIFLARFSFQQELQILKDVSLGTMSIFSSLLAIVATAGLISQDVVDRTVYTILAKPVPRFEYLLGKFLGLLALLAVSLIVMGALFAIVLYAREQVLLGETARQMNTAPRELVDDALNQIRAAGLSSGVLLGVIVIFIKAALIAALTLFVSTFATTNIFTIA